MSKQSRMARVRRRAAPLLAASLVLALARAARAEDVVLLPHRGDATLGAARDEAQHSLERALGAEGLHVIAHADAARRAAGSAGAACESVDCAPFLVRTVDASLAAAVAVWASSDGGGAEVVNVTLVDAHGRRYPGKADVKAGGVEEAVEEALLDARGLQRIGPGPWLSVHGRPDGARVLLNGKLVGTTPYRATVASGRHTVEVRREGYRPHLQTVDVPPNTARQVEVDAELELRASGAGSAADAAAPTETRIERPLVGPLLLAGAGLLLTAADVVFILDTGCARRGPTGLCKEEDQLDDGVAIALGAVGIGAMLGAGLWYLWGGEEVPAHAAVRVRPGLGAVAVEGRF